MYASPHFIPDLMSINEKVGSIDLTFDGEGGVSCVETPILSFDRVIFVEGYAFAHLRHTSLFEGTVVYNARASLF